MFRLVSSNRLNHFTLVLLYGSCGSSADPKCKLLSLYPVKGCRRYIFKDGGVERGKPCKKVEKGVGKFWSLNFPETFKSLQQAILNDKEVKRMLSDESRVQLSYPEFVRGESLEVAYAKTSDHLKLKEYLAFHLRTQQSCSIRVANLDGCLLSRISRKSRNVGVVLAINDVLEPLGSLLAGLQSAMKRVITHFVMAVVVAGLPEVYPPTPDDEAEDDSFEEDDESNSSDEEQPDTALGWTGSGYSGIVASNSSSETTPAVKEGVPDVLELSYLADDIPRHWKKLGRVLKVPEEKLAQFDIDYKDDAYERAYQMLLCWKEMSSDNASYQVLFDALNTPLVGRSDLAKKYCCY